jgi:hypothetical protein
MEENSAPYETNPPLITKKVNVLFILFPGNIGGMFSVLSVITCTLTEHRHSGN